MASVDKLYGTNEQYDELLGWLSSRIPGATAHFYQRSAHKPKPTRAIAMFPYDIDMWLLHNCPFDWVVNQIKEQYNIDQHHRGQ